MTYIAVCFYILSMTAANLLVAQYGPVISPLLAFFLIGLDLSLRDYLHQKLRALQMLGMIASGGALTYVLNQEAGIIAVASAVAFSSAALVDWSIFSSIKGSWLKRSNYSNIGGAAVDSVVFPTIAFGALMPHIVALQFVAKVGGGVVWSYLINGFALSRASFDAHQKP